MHLRLVELVNWRSYRKARFEFPRPHGEKNVTLIKAPNAYGKTSFFEAVALGLFGRDGLALVPQAWPDNTTERPKVNFSKFLENVLHHRAIENGASSCAVNLVWEDEAGDPIEVKRTWHFRNNGSHKVNQDQLIIYEGTVRSPVEPPPATSDKELWERDWIARRFVQSSLAKFFLFDGEQVQSLANRDMSDQVRDSIEGLLGLPTLRSLKDSLEKYAQRKHASVTAPSDTVVAATKARIEELEDRISGSERELERAKTELGTLDQLSSDLIRGLGRYGEQREGTQALIKNLLADEQKHRNEANKALEDLANLISGDIALAISGWDLTKETLSRLRSEAKREKWEAGRDEVNRNLDRFAKDLYDRIGRLIPPIRDRDRDAMIEEAKDALAALSHPPPEGCADGYLHPALIGAMRSRAIDRLEAVGHRASGELG